MRLIYALILITFTITACATSGTEISWTDASVEQLSIGMSREAVIAQFGEPIFKSQTASGEILTYKRPSDESQGTNKFLRITNPGFFSGTEAYVIDLLDITIVDDRVADYKYQENIKNSY